MGKPKAPQPPDPYRVAAAQTEQNVNTALANAQLNRVNEVTPYGSVAYSYAYPQSTGGTSGGGTDYHVPTSVGDMIAGAFGGSFGRNGTYGSGDYPAVPQYTRTVTESPNQAALRQGQEGLGIALNDLASNQVGRVNELLSAPYDPRRIDLSQATGGKLDLGQALGDYGKQLEQDTYNLATSNLGREFGRAEEDLRSRLANQGITPGSEAFGAEMEAFNRGKGQAYTDAELRARQTAEASRMQRLNEIMQQRGTNLAEALKQYGIDTSADLSGRQVPLSEITSIMSGTPLTPINPGAIATAGVNPTDVAGIYQNNFQNQLGVYQQQMGARNALLGGLFGLGGAAAGSGLFGGGGWVSRPVG